MERRIRRQGRGLTEAELQTARLAGAAVPEKIRVLEVDSVPMPGWGWVQRIAARFGFDSSTTAGLCLRYGIFLRRDSAHDPQLLAHECVHTGQYERLGSLWAFLRRYLAECLTIGYWQSPLEREARQRAAESVRQQDG